ncbi:ExeM/NucH family extracellular endonuclease [Nocardioides sp. STR2]|uniref:ExeM/NucH family extracellular endonuclease n=1 Tax=Nocardioides pini TaxID=2975053 RepID=A0ABT4CBF0_9ACTN|nr:ExeM/NucH family extracellular endonuclease [Nocardioides pini]MCY4726292.1 ExeM/NucH family extracellular endonuclease [Nocardioides pini]
MQTSAFVRRAAGGISLGLLTAGLSVLSSSPASAALANHLVVNEAYGGGGNSGATWTNDFIELYNPTDAPISLTGLSVQYRSSGGTGTGFTNLSGTVAAKSHFLVQQAAGSGGTTALPTPDAIGTLAMSGTAGTVALVTGTETVTPTAGNTIDLVGWGGATLREGTAAPATTNSTSVARKVEGDDTNDNSVDFAAGVPSPTNSAGQTQPPATGGNDPVEVTIAEVQGTGAESPLIGDAVVTEGVVTAAFPTGGYNGFYIQTGGEDTTPGASDGVFVYEPNFASTIAVGDSVEVEGVVEEFSTLTEIDATKVTELAQPLPAVVPNTVLPGTDCALPGGECLTGAALDAAREEFEGEAFQPTAPMTVTDSYDFGVTSSSYFGEIGIAAASIIPLVTPTEVIDAQDTAAIAARTAYNAAHLVILDDGSSATYWNTSNTAGAQDQPVPWLTADHTVRVGAGVTFHQPVVLDYRFGWKLQPQRQVVGKPTGLVTFEQDRPAAPAEVGGDLELATFNVLNYFTTFGGDVVGCTAFVDRDDNPIATRSCSSPNGPRGAWNQVNFERQEAKIVNAINTMDADIVSLEELENSRSVDGASRDEALAALVAALNADAGTQRWAFVPSPSVVPASEDVIRTGFIYDPRTVSPVGESEIHDVSAFDNARDPLGQVFKPKGANPDQAFAVIVNHFKSKGSGVDDGTGQGNANPDRVAQATALTQFASTFATARGTDKVFLTGDFNAYSMEDPVQVIEAAGFTSLESTDDPAEESYSFSGTSGSLDHVFANAAAKAMVTGVDLWEINANESVFYQYSRYNYVGTNLYTPEVYASSDHNPEVVGIKVPVKPEPPATVEVAAKVTPQVVVVDRTEATVHATVTRGSAAPASGTVEVREGGTVLASGPVSGGVANVKLPVFATIGDHVLTVRYLDGTAALAEQTVTVTVLRAASDIRVLRATAVQGKKAVLKVAVEDSDLGAATGKVRVKVHGTWRSVRLEDGRAKVRLPAFAKPGTKRVVVSYTGSSSVEGDRQVVKVRVKRR